MPKRFSINNLKRVRFETKDGKPVRLGSGMFGIVYKGEAIFEHPETGKTVKQRAAIKRFKPHTFHGIEKRKFVENFRATMNDLLEAGVRIPKMEIGLDADGEPTLILQYFGKGKKSKLRGHAEIELSYEEGGLKQKMDLIAEYAKIINAGYVPFSDVAEIFKSTEILTFDLDMLVLRRENKDYYSSDDIIPSQKFVQNCFEQIEAAIWKLAPGEKFERERIQLYDIAMKTIKNNAIGQLLREKYKSMLFKGKN